MKINRNPYVFFENYCLRIPFLPLNNFFDFTNKKEIDNSLLINQWENKHLKEAIFLASPYLYSELDNWFLGKIDDPIKINRLKQTFIKYITRASARCTPFGLFAGISVGSFGKHSIVNVLNNTQHIRYTRLDMNYLSALCDWMTKEPIIKNQLLFYPNNTLYKVADQLRYIEHSITNSNRSHSIEGIDNSIYIKTVIDNARSGKNIADLANSLVDDDICFEDAEAFIHELIDNQILVSELALSISGDDMLTQLIAILHGFNNCEVYYVLLKDLKKSLLHLDNNINNSIDDYKKIYPKLNTIGVHFDEKYVFQTDLFFKTKQNQLNIKHAYALQKAFSLLIKLKPNKKNDSLNDFKNAFVNRYDFQEIPLALALDIELGIGYLQNIAISDTVPFLDDITPKQKIVNSKIVTLSNSDKIIHKKLLIALQNDAFTMVLSDDDFKNIESNWHDLPDTISALIEMVVLNEDETIVLEGISGSNAVNILSRFCYGDPNLMQHVKNTIAVEDKINKNNILFEIIHIPEARIGNILQRPLLRNFELPYLGKSNLPKEKQLNINDITVSVRNDKIILRSKSLNKEIIPRLTSAHNFSSNSLPIYHFLCDLQTQNKRSELSFSWKNIALNQSFLPRVVYKKIILAKASWVINVSDITFIIDLLNNTELLLDAVNKWKNSKQIPKYIQWIDGDNTLLINLENATMIQVLFGAIKNKDKFIIEEFLFTNDTIVKRETSNFTNQFVVSFYNDYKLKNSSL